jgi:hypothetical protein
MNLLVTALRLFVPESLRRRELGDLFAIAAAAFECEMPQLEGLTADEQLHVFALFTRDQVEAAVQGARNFGAIRFRLYQGAYEVGCRLRVMLRLETMDDVMHAARVLYRALDIDFHGTPSGAITIQRCFFSCYYSSQVCQVISALDAGLMAGLAGGGELVFTARITEGSTCCQACFRGAEVFG